MATIYKLCVREGTQFFLKTEDEPYESFEDIWTTIKSDELLSVHLVRTMAKNNMAKDMAKKLFKDIKVWVKIKIDDILTDIEVWCNGARIDQ